MQKLNLKKVMKKLVNDIIALKENADDESDYLLENVLTTLQIHYPKHFDEVMKELS